jgi:D-3-phosphoglycerate dehydrogenase
MRIAFLDPLEPEVIDMATACLPGHEIAVAPEPGRLPDGIEAAEAAVWSAYELDATAIASMLRLRLLQRIGFLSRTRGDVSAAFRRGLAVSALPWANSERTAQHALALMAAVLRRATGIPDGDIDLHPEHIPALDRSTASPAWLQAEDAARLAGKTVGIIGFGEVGACLARLLAPLDCRVLYLKRSRLSPAHERYFGIEYAAFDDLLRASDVIVNLMPFKGANPKLIGARELGLLRRGAVYLSNGRANIVEDGALAAALRDGRLPAAGFDDYGHAHLAADSPLRSLDNLIVTPQTVGGTPGWVDTFARLAENLRRLDSGEALLYPLPPDAPPPIRG